MSQSLYITVDKFGRNIFRKVQSLTYWYRLKFKLKVWEFAEVAPRYFSRKHKSARTGNGFAGKNYFLLCREQVKEQTSAQNGFLLSFLNMCGAKMWSSFRLISLPLCQHTNLALEGMPVPTRHADVPRLAGYCKQHTLAFCSLITSLLSLFWEREQIREREGRESIPGTDK